MRHDILHSSQPLNQLVCVVAAVVPEQLQVRGPLRLEVLRMGHRLQVDMGFDTDLCWCIELHHLILPHPSVQWH